MFGSIGSFFKKIMKQEEKEIGSKDNAKERLHLVLMQDRANVSADFLELMKQEIIDVIKKYIVVDENSIDVRLTNQPNEDGTNGAPALYANIPIMNIKNDMKAEKIKETEEVSVSSEKEEIESEVKETKKEKTEKKKETKKKETKKKETKKQEKKKEEKPEETDTEINEESKEEAESEEEKEDEEDVTFDDLLKKAEEEENQKVSEG